MMEDPVVFSGDRNERPEDTESNSRKKGNMFGHIVATTVAVVYI